MNHPLKIAIVVQGRINAFDLARELMQQGHEITLVTNYPAFVCERWGLPAQVVMSLLPHGLANRLAERLGLAGALEAFLHRWYGWLAERALRGRRFDAVIAYSGVAEELFRCRSRADGLRVLLRASSHIRAQRQILLEEEARAGVKVDKPSAWRVGREEREYALADRIFIHGRFSERSFLEWGLEHGKLWPIHMAADLRVFQPGEEVLVERRRRVLSGVRLQVLNTGTFSHRKGCLDMVELARQSRDFADFTFVGTVVPEAAALAASAEKAGLVRFLPRVPERDLPAVYARADVFAMPTLEDGFPAVVAHAKASGLPVLVTANCDTADIIEHGTSGWVLPVRSPEAFVEKLRALHQDRQALERMSEAARQGSRSRDWKEVAAEVAARVAEQAAALAAMGPLKIAIGVQGRFHAFGLAAGLLDLGHEVRVLTNYPAWAAARFGLPPGVVRSHLLHGLVMRLLDRLGGLGAFPRLAQPLHAWFGRWLAARLKHKVWDVSYTWSSVSLEHLDVPCPPGRARLLARGSTHIVWQDQQMEKEVRRSGAALERPVPEIMAREVAEYQKADAVVVLSSFCRRSFLEQGMPGEKVRVMVPGVNVGDFTPSPEAWEARRQRHLGRAPLRVLMTGSFSYRKGALDLAEAARQLHGAGVEFRVVGARSLAAAALAAEMQEQMDFHPRVPQAELGAHYDWADVFVMPSLEEGLAAVLWQAAAAGLPILGTEESGLGELLDRGACGWMIPACDPAALVERLTWARDHREELLAMMRASAGVQMARSWRQAAEDFAGICREVCERKRHKKDRP